MLEGVSTFVVLASRKHHRSGAQSGQEAADGGIQLRVQCVSDIQNGINSGSGPEEP